MRKFILIVIGLIGAANTYAGTGDGMVNQVLVTQDNGGVFFFITDTHENAPACSTAGGGLRWAQTLSTDAGKAQYSLVLSAQAQGLPISVQGTGGCGVWSADEQPRWITLDSQ